jgi:hypothetical protein
VCCWADDMSERHPRLGPSMADPTGQALTVERLLTGGAAEAAARPLPRDRLAARQAGLAETEHTALAPTEAPSILRHAGGQYRGHRPRPPNDALHYRHVGTNPPPLEPRYRNGFCPCVESSQAAPEGRGRAGR